ncbi:MAG: ribonuclease Z, partial [Bacteroidales bacterium]|nr:ribonuclease Z [Bacteroidales bacterium]
ISETVLQFEIIYHPLNFKEKELIFEDKKLKIFSFPLEHRVPTCGFLFQEKPSLPNLIKRNIEHLNLSIEDIKEIRSGGDYQSPQGKIIPHHELVSPPPEPRSYAYCSDTRYFAELPQYINQVELLYSECTFMKDMQEVATDKFHMTTQDAAQLAKETHAEKLIAGHFSARYKDLSGMRAELQSFFKEAELVNENQTYHIRDEK